TRRRQDFFVNALENFLSGHVRRQPLAQDPEKVVLLDILFALENLGRCHRAMIAYGVPGSQRPGRVVRMPCAAAAAVRWRCAESRPPDEPGLPPPLPLRR